MIARLIYDSLPTNFDVNDAKNFWITIKEALAKKKKKNSLEVTQRSFCRQVLISFTLTLQWSSICWKFTE